MKRTAKKTKGIAGGKDIGILSNAARRFGGADLRSIFLTPDGSWGLLLRLLILCVAFLIAAPIALYLSDGITRLILSHHLGRTVSVAEYREMVLEEPVIPFVVTLGLFILVFSLGGWTIRNHDALQAAQARFRARSEEAFFNAVCWLTERTSSGGSNRNAHGLRELGLLAHQGAIEKERIHAVTRAGHDLRGVNLENAMLAGLDLRSVRLSDALLMCADLSGANLSCAELMDADLSGTQLISACLADADLSKAQLIGADLSGADLRDADLSGVNAQGAVYDENTQFPEGFDPAKHGLKLI